MAAIKFINIVEFHGILVYSQVIITFPIVRGLFDEFNMQQFKYIL